MTETIEIINEIVKYGLNPNVEINDKEVDIEKSLIKIYAKFFEINFQFDKNDYPPFNKVALPNITENLLRNFPDLGFYHNVLDCHELNNEPNNAVGDPYDDLTDIILDLLEVKWRNENNSEQDALWFFEFIFRAHTQQHILSLLNYLKSKNG